MLIRNVDTLMLSPKLLSSKDDILCHWIPFHRTVSIVVSVTSNKCDVRFCPEMGIFYKKWVMNWDKKWPFLSKITMTGHNFLHFAEFFNENALDIYGVHGLRMILSIFKDRELGVRVCIRTWIHSRFSFFSASSRKLTRLHRGLLHCFQGQK